MTDPGDAAASAATEARRAQLRASLELVRQRIALACTAAGRQADTVTLVAVTKFFPATDAALLLDAGVTDLGESRDQEAAGKVAEVAALTAAPVRWHFVGRLQRNKARSVGRYADLVHSVDRAELLDPLARGVADAGRPVLPVLVQVSLDGDTTRGGVPADDVSALARAIEATDGLQVAGVMAIAPLDADPDQAFERLHQVSARLRDSCPQASVISAGMSNDLEAAVAHGATHVRIGTALLGRRNTNFG